MKKISMFIFMLTITLTLSACGLFGGNDNKDPQVDPEALANAIVLSFNGDVTYLLAAMENLTFEEGSTQEAYLELGIRPMGSSVVNNITIYLENTEYATPNGFIARQKIELQSLDFNQSFELITVSELGEVIVYINAASLFELMYDNLGLNLKTALGIQTDWMRFDVLDSLVTFVEVEILKDFIVGNMVYQLPVSNLEVIDHSLQEMLQVDFSLFNFSLASLYNSLLTLDIDHINLYLGNIDYLGLAQAVESNYLVPNVAMLLEEYRVELTNLNYDVDAWKTLLETQGLEVFFNALETSDFEAIKTLVTDPRLLEMIDHYIAGDLVPYLVTTLLSENEMDLRNIQGFDYDAFYALLGSFNYSVLGAGLLEVDTTAFVHAIETNTVDAFIDAQTNLEVFALLDFMREALNNAANALDAQRNVQDTLATFENMGHYLDLSTYLNHALMNPSVAKNEDHEVITTFPITLPMLKEVVEGFFNDAYLNLLDAGFETNEVVIDDAQLTELLGYLDGVTIEFTYKPADLSYMVLSTDLMPFLNNVMPNSMFTKARLTIRNHQAQSVEIPEGFDDLNALIEDVAKLMLLEKAGNYLRTYEMYTYAFNITNGQTMTLREMTRYINGVGIFDLDLSYVNKDQFGNFTIDLFYIDGERVFDLPLTLTQINQVFSFPVNRTKVLTGLNYINDDSFYMTRLLLMYLVDENRSPYDDIYYPVY